MEAPTPKDLAAAVGISFSYAHKILLGGEHGRTPPRPLAILIYRKTGWPHESIADLTEDQMQVFEQVEPWTPRAQEEAA